jgi:putative membrane-bound dehydrogenase-like protein
MQPPPPAFGVGGQPQPEAGAPPGDAEQNLFGTRFPWAECRVTIDGQALDPVGLRYSGDITYFVSARGLKRPLALQFDRFSEQQWNGLDSITLHSMPLDPSKAREALAFSIFRAAGVPAARTTFAEVSLTVAGRHDRELLGLYTLVEGVDDRFLGQHFGGDDGLLLRPFGIRGIDFLGEDWAAYTRSYRPHREATEDEQQRVIAFARLVNEAGDDEFREQIASFIDVEAFLRFLAANALTSNLESFFVLGHNYSLYLDPATNRFAFIPGDLEFSLANFLLMGTPDQLMDLSLTKPYPGKNKVSDRLLAIPEIRQQYLALVQEVATTAFDSERLIALAAAAEATTQPVLEREAAALAVRNEAPAGLGGAGGIGPQPPDLKTFVERRSASLATQLAGDSLGFVPQPLQFGPPPGANNNPQQGNFGPRRSGSEQPIDEATFRTSVQAPPEFDATLFAASPEANYPVAIAAAPTGEVFIAIDEQGSLGRTPGGGRIARCLDHDDDGRADEINVFAKVDHPRGLCYRDGSVWVMHPPTLSVFHDDDLDGISDRQEILVTGLTTSLIDERGGDHTTNCVRMGIDGWLYIGVGDYGIKQATGADGRTISLRGGGIVRVRPDGTELEIYCTGLRNPFDIAIDPFLNLFTRDNTNDGAGWDVRVSHLVQTAEYGYPRLFANFTTETMPTLGAFGGGGGTGGLIVSNPQWPEPYNRALFTGDWGRSEVYCHPLKPHGPTFDLRQEVFLTMPRATGMDVDAAGRMYVASWWSGEAAVYVGPHVGFITRVTPKGFSPIEFPDLKQASLTELIDLLGDRNAVTRLHVQGEILHRGRSTESSAALSALAADPNARPETRVAAIFTLKQLDGTAASPALLALAEDPAVREHALRALTDRATQLEGLDAAPFIGALDDPSPRVRAQALICLSRLGDASAAPSILPLTSRPDGSALPAERPLQNQPDPDRVIPHLAIRALIALHAVEDCLAALSGPHAADALQALHSMHDPLVVEGLVKQLASARSGELRQQILIALIRLYHREADYDGSWWGIRPDTTGPYYDRTTWEMSDRIGAVLTAAVLDSEQAAADLLKAELARHRVSLAGVSLAAAAPSDEPQAAIIVPKADPADPNQIGNIAYEDVVALTLMASGDATRGEALFRRQSCTACHTTADGQVPIGPHLVDIGRRYRPAELIESIVKPTEKLAQGYEAYAFSLADGSVLTGFVVSESADTVTIRESNGLQHALPRDEIELRALQKVSVMPEGLVGNLAPEQLADLLAYLQSLTYSPD